MRAREPQTRCKGSVALVRETTNFRHYYLLHFGTLDPADSKRGAPQECARTTQSSAAFKSQQHSTPRWTNQPTSYYTSSLLNPFPLYSGSTQRKRSHFPFFRFLGVPRTYPTPLTVRFHFIPAKTLSRSPPRRARITRTSSLSRSTSFNFNFRATFANRTGTRETPHYRTM